jgi:hypothetical protein
VNFAALFTTFGLIFLAELPDKTAYTMLLLAARGRPVQVFLGSCAAFAVQGLVAVALGSLAAKLPPQAIRYLASAMFLGFGLWLLFSPVEPDEKQAPLSKNRALAQSFVLVFLAELGDATQLGTAAAQDRRRALLRLRRRQPGHRPLRSARSKSYKTDRRMARPRARSEGATSSEMTRCAPLGKSKK